MSTAEINQREIIAPCTFSIQWWLIIIILFIIIISNQQTSANEGNFKKNSLTINYSINKKEQLTIKW